VDDRGLEVRWSLPLDAEMRLRKAGSFPAARENGFGRQARSMFPVHRSIHRVDRNIHIRRRVDIETAKNPFGSTFL
jgi:hypothetical protein